MTDRVCELCRRSIRIHNAVGVCSRRDSPQCVNEAQRRRAAGFELPEAATSPRPAPRAEISGARPRNITGCHEVRDQRGRANAVMHGFLVALRTCLSDMEDFAQRAIRELDNLDNQLLSEAPIRRRADLEDV